MTRGEIARLLQALALRDDQVIVHASLSSFGHVESGAHTLCQALVDEVGEAGVIVMPAFTYAETLGGLVGAGSVNTAHEGGERRCRPFHSDLPVSREIGAVAETFRHLPGVLRSIHPTHSFAAWGRQAREVLSTQRDNNPLGPVKKINVAQGQVLLLGTSLQSATAIHLAAEQLGLPYVSRRTAVRVNAAGYEERVVLENVPGCSMAFSRLEERLDAAKVRCVALARGTARKMSVRYLVNLAIALLERDPAALVCERPDCESCAATRAGLSGRTAAPFLPGAPR